MMAYGVLLCSAQMGYDNKNPFAYTRRYQHELRKFLKRHGG